MFVNTTIDGAVKLLDCQEKLAVGDTVVDGVDLLHPINTTQKENTDNNTDFIFLIFNFFI